MDQKRKPTKIQRTEGDVDCEVPEGRVGTFTKPDPLMG